MRLIQGHFITLLHSIRNKAPLILTKAAQWCFEAKKACLPGYEITWIVDRAGELPA